MRHWFIFFLLLASHLGWGQWASLSLELSEPVDVHVSINGLPVSRTAYSSYHIEHIDNEIIWLDVKQDSLTLFSENIVLRLDELNAFLLDVESGELDLMTQSGDFSVEFLLFSGNTFSFSEMVKQKKAKHFSVLNEPQITPIEEPFDTSAARITDEPIQLKGVSVDSLKTIAIAPSLDTNKSTYTLLPGCTDVLSSSDLETLVNGLQTTSYGNIQIRMAQKATAGKCISTDQLRQILTTLEDDELKLMVLRQNKSRWMDRLEGKELEDLFQFEFAKEEFYEIIEP